MAESGIQRTVTFPQEILDRVTREAQREHRSFSGQVVYLVTRGLEVVDREREILERGGDGPEMPR